MTHKPTNPSSFAMTTYSMYICNVCVGIPIKCDYVNILKKKCREKVD